MKKIYSKILLVAILIASIALISATDEYYFKINKSFEIFGDVFRYIATNYVEDVDPEELMQAGIEGMLSRLDPYTVFYSNIESEDMDVLTSGSYTGLGITVGIKNNMLTIIGIRDGYSAQKKGLRIGDRIYKIDTSVIINSTTKDLRLFTRGIPGSTLDMWVLRDGIRDTLHFRLTREIIKVNNVAFSDFVSEGIAYIKLERFSRNSAEEVRQAINKLMAQDTISSLILDLRDNPGGLLEAAVSVTELFIPKGKLIVSTKNRNISEGYNYYSLQKPILPNVPMAVLINENSASASEIVAGAIQDLDRGLIIGRKSYGKGLVQSVFELPYRTSLKITTAKYYTPSGRCIQRLDLLKHSQQDESDFTQNSKFAFSELENNNSHIYYTANGRQVKELIGIIPDTVINPLTYSEFTRQLVNNDLIFNFANKYTASIRELPENFNVDKKLLKEFDDYCRLSGFKYESSLIQKLDELRRVSIERKLPKGFIDQLSKLNESASSFEKDLIGLFEEEVADLLYFEIIARLKSNEEVIKLSLSKDVDLISAKSLLNSKLYNKILAIDNSIEPLRNH